MEAGVEVELGVYCWGAWVPGYGLASLPEPLAGLADEQRSWMVGFERLVVATGARDVAFAFKGWDQPGVMGARAFEALVDTYDAFSGRRLAILGSGEPARRTARLAIAKGLEIAAIVDIEDASAEHLSIPGVEILSGYAPVAAAGGIDGVERLTVRDLTGGAERVLDCDTIVQAVSLTPVIELLDVLGAGLAMRPALGGYAPVSPDGAATTLAQVFIAGDVAGAPGGAGLTDDEAAESGRRAGQAVLASLGRGEPPAPAQRPAPGPDAVARQQAWMRALTTTTEASVIVCQCEEVSREALLAVRQPDYLGPPSKGMAARDLGVLLEDGPANQDQIKRLTRACMGPCQARRCREQVALILAGASNQGAEGVPLAGYRAPVRPLPLKVLAAWDESAVMAEQWDVWFGVKGQWTPYADVGTEREALHDNLLGGTGHA
jgi:thioredoxin reductase